MGISCQFERSREPPRLGVLDYARTDILLNINLLICLLLISQTDSVVSDRISNVN
jgi:hypothetical protein